MSKVLGLDLGTNSVGWCLLEDELNNEKIIDIGVRVFEAGVNDINTKNEQSRNAERTAKRQARRQNRRRKQRKSKLIRKLKELNFISELDKTEFLSINPYQLRAKAIYEQVSLVELARIFFHIIQRRGFKSSKKQKLDEKEKGAIFDGSNDIIGINQLKDVLNSGEFKTIGEYFATLNSKNQKVRSRYIDRSMYESEFELIWEKQKEFYPELLSDKNKLIVKNKNVFFQRPLKSQKKLIGKCIFEKDKRRANLSSFESQEARMLQQVNNLKIISDMRRTDEEQALTKNERDKLLDYLYNHESFKFDKNLKEFKKLLSIGQSERIKLNLEHQGKLDGMKSLFKIKEAFGEKFDDIYNNKNKLHVIWNTLNFAEDEAWLKEYAVKRWNLNETQAEKFAKINLEVGYASLSLKALNKILPFLRDGYLYNEACDLAGYNHSLADEIIKKTDLLPKIPKIANPIVMSSLYQMRNVVNNLISKYGKPDTIRVEMARDLKLPKDKRVEIQKSNKERENDYNKIREILISEMSVPNPKRDDILKYKLWQECKETCPYTGKSIAANQLFGKHPSFQIEHILPYSRTLDDSYMNKTLCYVEENIEKGNRTPYEFYSYKKDEYDKIKDRIKGFPKFSDSKIKRFYTNDIEEFYKIEGDSDFISRQLNDTRYISKAAKNILKYICDDVCVTKGEATAKLRYFWGLSNLLKNKDEKEVENENIEQETEEKQNGKKIRTDHRHHAIDATVIACTTRSFLQRLSTYHGVVGYIDRENDAIRERFQNPWNNFRSDLEKAIQNIIISHRFKNKVTGGLHEETYYSKLYDINKNERTNEKGIPLYAIRKKLENLTAKEIKNIVDPVINELITNFLVSKGIDINKSNKIPVNTFSETLFAPSKNPEIKVPIKRVRVAVPSTSMIKLKDYNVWVEPGSNHHIVIYSDDKGKIDFKTVSLFEAAKREANKLPAISKELPPNCEFILTLQRNEMLLVGNVPETFDINNKSTYNQIFDLVYRVQKMDKSGLIVFRKHFVTATNDKDNTGVFRRHHNTLFDSSIRKIVVDSCGFISYE
ncbi:MAG TPA: type II CRISPR RNA-guided endonuclease Cas9 [Candidatus Kapabacteria bacterium]|nr:type II CRISPR RNA-guided endonuclease Cas9 [Candidatus Kapabacteria bacterium]